jgi:hypothetical protein
VDPEFSGAGVQTAGRVPLVKGNKKALNVETALLKFPLLDKEGTKGRSNKQSLKTKTR